MVLLNHSIKNLLPLWGVLLLNPAFSQPLALFNHFDKGTQPYYFALNYNNANDALAIKDLSTYSWYGYTPQSGTNLAIINHRLDLGMHYDNWYMGYALRYDIFLKTNRSTLDILELINTKSDLPQGEAYTIDLNLYALASHNLIISHSFEINKHLRVFAGGALIKAFGMQEGFVDAYATIGSNNSYDFNGYSEYYYDTNHLYELEVDKPAGYGYSLKFGIEYQKGGHTLRLIAEDFLSNIYWQELPYSQVSLNSNQKTYDENGYLEYNPTISGYELYKDHVQNLEAKYLLEYEYQYSERIHTKIALNYYQDYLLPYIAFKYRSNDDTTYALGYDTHFHQLSLGVGFDELQASIATNDITQPTALSLNLSYSF